MLLRITYNYIIAMVMRPLRFVLCLSTCRMTNISHLASFAHPQKLIHENFCLKQIFDIHEKYYILKNKSPYGINLLLPFKI